MEDPQWITRDEFIVLCDRIDGLEAFISAQLQEGSKERKRLHHQVLHYIFLILFVLGMLASTIFSTVLEFNLGAESYLRTRTGQLDLLDFIPLVFAAAAMFSMLPLPQRQAILDFLQHLLIWKSGEKPLR